MSKPRFDFNQYVRKCTKWRLIFAIMIMCIVVIEIHQMFFLMPSNYTLLAHMEDLHHARVNLYQIHGNQKFFRENPMDNHLDERYSQEVGYVGREKTVETLYFLFEAFLQWLKTDPTVSSLTTAYADTEVVPSEFLSKYKIRDGDGLLYFLDYGSLLGSYRNQSIIPWDVNGDIGFMANDLRQLPLRYEDEQWIFEQNPVFYHDDGLTVYDQHNTVAGRVISKQNGVFINLMAYSLICKTELLSDPYVYSTGDFLNTEKWHKATDLFPLQREGILKDLTRIPIPHSVEKWLLAYYESLKVPPEFENAQNLNYDTSYRDYDMYGNNGMSGDDGRIEELKKQLEAQKAEIEQIKQLILEEKNDNS